MSLISPTPCHPIVWNPSELKSCKDTGTLGPAVYLCQKAYLVLLSKFFCISAQRRSISLESWKWGQASINTTGMRTPLPLQLATSEKPSHSWGTTHSPSLSYIVTEGMKQVLPLSFGMKPIHDVGIIRGNLAKVYACSSWKWKFLDIFYQLNTGEKCQFNC